MLLAELSSKKEPQQQITACCLLDSVLASSSWLPALSRQKILCGDEGRAASARVLAAQPSLLNGPMPDPKPGDADKKSDGTQMEKE